MAFDRRQAGSGLAQRGGRAAEAPIGSTSATPSTILGAKLVMWLRSDNVTTSSGAVTAWPDLGPLNQTAPSQSNGTLRPALVADVLDGWPAVRYDGAANKVLDSIDGFTGFAAGDHPAVYAVMSFTGSEAQSGVGYALSDNSGNARVQELYAFTDGNLYLDTQLQVGQLSRASFNHAVPSATAVYKLEVTATHASRISINGSIVGTGTARAGGLERTPNDLKVGNAFGAGAVASRADLFELVFVNPQADAGEETALMSYFGARYPNIGL